MSNDKAKYICPDCGETSRLEAVMVAYFDRVPLDGDGDFNAFNGRACETEVISVYCANCGEWHDSNGDIGWPPYKGECDNENSD